MVQFTKLKLYGFKSFVDKTELEIGPGLNGIVGPNGCGKSNLVEALRWVMGEKSAKNMRGGGMEDVIFAGTSKRPARTLAEVSVVVSNDDKTAPAPFDNATEIEINRKIERDKGSQYRVNGKAVRARDVNLLFADTMTGANSPALVSQGRITEIITAKPEDRRRILEESAGISGLHTRRHEAELRLRAAEQNLTRLDDVLSEMRTRLSSLKRQARQAERYKELNEQIRQIDMTLSWYEWRDLREKIKSGRNDFATNNDLVQKALEQIQTLTKQIEKLDETLPDIRQSHMEARAILQNFRVSLERLEQDIRTKSEGLREAEQQKVQLDKDRDFIQMQLDQLTQDWNEAQDALNGLESDVQNYPDAITQQEEQLSEAQAAYDDLRSEKQRLETEIALVQNKKHTLSQQESQARTRVETLQRSIATLDADIATTREKIQGIQDHPAYSVDLVTMQDSVRKAEQHAAKKKVELDALQADHTSVQSKMDAVQADLRGIDGELQALQTLLDRSENNTETDIPADQRLLNHLKVQDGYEQAVSLALGSWAAYAGIEKNAAVYWQETDSKIATPDGTKPLSDYVTAPSALQSLLNAIGVADTPDVQTPLQPGQMLVTKDGQLLRWDGLVVTKLPQADTGQTALLLEQRNRAEQLQSSREAKKAEYETLQNEKIAIKGRINETQTAYDEKSLEFKALQKEYQDNLAQQDRFALQLENHTGVLNDQIKRFNILKDECVAAEEQLAQLCKEIEKGDDSALDAQQKTIAALSDQIVESGKNVENCRSELARLRQAQISHDTQIRDLKTRIARYEEEQTKLAERQGEIDVRIESVIEKIDSLKTVQNSDDEDSMREDLLSQIAKHEESAKDLQIKMEEADATYRRLQTELREAESQAAEAREKRAVIQTTLKNFEEELNRIENSIQERFESTPQILEETILSLFESAIPDTTTLQGQKETYVRQRDSIGPVNLRAALEAEETETQLTEMETEQQDLVKAIEQLRTGIAKLNREARDRLAVAFQRVNHHFQTLFSQLFEGGNAYLHMIESDDPLESGLEIFAQPPGKSLQKLSLLSGGEQTLTATALIFAMFLTNPSPICVLDEIDAPLDDANVDRICTLMEKIAADTQTRFIVITHHRMSMARMDRLYGVTMGERGVSQLVSVDMALQEELQLAETA